MISSESIKKHKNNFLIKDKERLFKFEKDGKNREYLSMRKIEKVFGSLLQIGDRDSYVLSLKKMDNV
jgi:hypothetical protein